MKGDSSWTDVPQVFQKYMADDEHDEGCGHWFFDVEAAEENRDILPSGAHRDPLKNAEEPKRRRRKNQGVHVNEVRERRIALGGTRLTNDERNLIREAFGAICVYCEAEHSRTIDHLTPIAWFGRDHLTNVAVSCIRCNARKSAMTFGKWMSQWTAKQQDRIRKRIADGQAKAIKLIDGGRSA